MNHLNKIILLMVCSNAHAAGGAFFDITESGSSTSTPVSISVCLNAGAQLSCQTFQVSTLALSIKTTIPNRSYSQVGIRVNTPGYTITSGAACTPLANGYCQFSTSNTTPTSIHLEGETALSQYLYIPMSTDPGHGYIEQGLLKSNGDVSTSTTTPTATPNWFPSGIAFATASGITRGYVSSSGLSAGVFMCGFSQDTGAFSDCALSGDADFVSPRGIAFLTSIGVQYAYVPDPDPSADTVHKCPLNQSSGALENCTQAVRGSDFPVLQPSAIAFATASGTRYAYLTDSGNSGGGVVYLCPLIDNGSFEGNSCQSTGTISSQSPNSANGIAFATFSGSTYAYITNPGTGRVYQCSWSPSDGTLSSCVDAASFKDDWTLTGIAFGTVKGVQYAYVSDSSTSRAVWRCTVMPSTGLFDTCTKTSTSTTGAAWYANGSVAMYPASS